MLVTILTAVCAAGVIGLVLGALIAFTAKKFEVETDPRIDEVQSVLPGANCGGCGYAGCADFADAIVTRGADPTLCTSCGTRELKMISHILGVEVDAKEKMVAVVYCGGSASRTVAKAQYNGVMDCRSASAVAGGGGKACRSAVSDTAPVPGHAPSAPLRCGTVLRWSIRNYAADAGNVWMCVRGN